MKLVRSDKMELAEALNKVTEDALKEKQAEAEQTPESVAADATVQAMAGPQGAGGPQAAVQGPNPSQQNLGSLLSTLRRGAA
jgi:hypothetical protein